MSSDEREKFVVLSTRGCLIHGTRARSSYRGGCQCRMGYLPVSDKSNYETSLATQTPTETREQFIIRAQEAAQKWTEE